MNAKSLLDVEELAQLFRVTRKTVQVWIANGMPVAHQGKKGRGNKTAIDLKEAVAWYFAVNFERLELDRARTKLANEQAQKTAFANALTKGNLMLADHVQQFVQAFSYEIASQFESIPGRGSAALSSVDEGARRETLLEVCRDSRRYLASWIRRVATSEYSAFVGICRKSRAEVIITKGRKP